nr:hypothetical protein [Moritella viscosa]SHO17788.1 Fibronectin type III domain protein [Moritella viscosa]
MPQALLVVAVGIAAGAAVAASMQPSAAQTDYSTSINTSGVNAEKPVTYGQAKTGAHKVFSEVVRSDSGDNDLLTVIYSLGEGPVHAINQLYIDDLPLFNNERDYTIGTIGQSDINYEFRRHVQVQVSNGAPEGYRFTMAEQNSDGRWKSTSTGNNVVSVCLKIKLDGYKGKIKSDNFNLTAKLKGVPVVDITKVDEPFVYQYNTSEQPGRNPALCLYDYLSNAAYGCAIEPEFLDKQSFIQAANWCDVNDLKIDGVVNQGQSYEENIKNLLTAFGGSIIDYNGDLYCVVDKPSVTVMDFDLSNTIGSIEIDYYPSENYFNQLETTWKDPSQNFKDDVVVYPPSIDDPTIQSDGFVKTNRLELPFTKNKANVDFLSSKFVKHAKSKTTITFTADVDGYLVQVSDVISMSNENRGWDKRLFRITEIERETFGDKVGQVKITATEYNEGVYVNSWVGDSTPVLTQPKSVPAVSHLAFNFKESRYGITGELTWNSTAYQIQETLVMYKLSAEPDTAFELYTKVEGSSCMFTSLKNNFYDFQVVNRDIFGSTSQPTTIRNVDLVDNTVFPAVTGLTTLPLNTPDFVFNWDDMMDVDVSVVDAMNPSVIGQGKVKDYFFCYEVKMKVNGNAVSTHSVTNNSFTYTYDLNVKDGLSRDVTAEVCIIGVAGAKSQLVSYRAINLQQQVPNGIVVTGGQANLFIAFDAPTESDHKGTEVHFSLRRDFVPSSATLLSDITSNTFTFTTLEPNIYFVRVGAYDVFGRDGIVYSKQYETSIVSVESILEDISKDQLNKSLFDEISGKANDSDVAKDIKDAIDLIPDVDTTALEAATKKVADDLTKTAAELEADTNAKVAAAKAKSTSDLNAAKATLQQAIDDSVVDLGPIGTRITNVEKQSKDSDTAMTSKVNGVISKANNNQSAITSVQQAVSNNSTSIATKITSVQAKTIADTSAKTTGDKALADAKTHANAAITTERNARTTADNALSTKINSTNAVVNANTADIKNVEQTIVTKDTAMAQRVDTLDSAVSLRLATIDKRDANWDFKEGLANWTQDSTISHITDPEEGDCMKLTSSNWPTNSHFIPVNPENVYELSFRIKQQSKNGSYNSYLGVRSYDKDKNEIGTTPRGDDTTNYTGTYIYCGKSGGHTPSEWTTYSGKITGVNGYNHHSFRPNTCFIKVMFIANYSGGKGEARVSWLDFNDVTERDITNARITTNESTIASRDAAMAQRVTKMEASVKSDSTAKANAAKAASVSDAASKVAALKVTLLADAKAKADAAAASAISTAANDSTNKANAAKAAAAIDAQTKTTNSLNAAKSDATTKANKALADAKTYANTKKNESTSYTNAKITEVNKTITDKDSAMATRLSNFATSTTSGLTKLDNESMNLDFSRGKIGWHRNYNASGYQLSNNLNDTFKDVAGKGKVYAAKAQQAIQSAIAIPVNLDTRSYRLTVEKRVTQVGANNNRFYAGLSWYDENHAYLGHSYVIASNRTSSTVQTEWDKYGENSSITKANIPSGYRDRVAYVRPMLLINWGGNSTCITEVAGVTFDDVTDLKETQASISTLEQTVTSKDTAMANRVTQMEASVKADSTNKANAAKAAAASDAASKVATAKAQSATDAATKSTKAKNDAIALAKTDANNKANAAKAAAATDASNKANAAKVSANAEAKKKADKALADAKAYTNAKATTERNHTNSKFTEAVNTASTALAAEASKVSTLEAKMNYVSDAAETPDNGDMLINGRMTKKDKDGRPLGWYAAYSNSNPATIGFDSSGAFLMSTSDSATGMSSNAFRVEKNTTYKIKIKVKAQTAATSGFYCWFYEYDAELPKGKFAISNAGGEAAVQEDTRIIQGWTNKPIGTSWETREFTYIPTSSAVFTSVGFLNWSGMGSNNKLYVDYCTITADKTVYIDSKYTDAVNIINTKDSAQTTARNILQSTVNGLSSSVTSTSSALATLDGKVKSTWAMRVDANGKVAGIGLSNDGASSSFAINADDFLVYDGTSDNAVFSVTDGKLLVNSAMIGELDARNIKAGAITAAHLDVNALDAVDAKIENATIKFAQITGTMQSGGFVAGSSGWQITQTGGAEFNDALFRGRIESSYIKGAFIEGGIFVGGTDFTVATQADTRSGVRYLAFATASGSSSNNANVGWSGYTVSNLASANYTGDGTVNYEGKTAYKNFARARKYAMQGNGSITFKKPPAGTNYRDNGAWSHLDSSGSYQVAFRIRVSIQVVGYTKAGALTTIGNFSVFDVTRNVQDWNGRVNVPHGSVTSSVSTKRSSWLTTYTVNSISCTLTSLPDFNFSGNYNRIGYRIFTESAPVNHPRAKGAGQHSSFTFKSK